jgi:tRNA threonylcarbamoyladenosine biosynthesis protein TsaE
MSKRKIILKSEKETSAFAYQFAKKLKADQVIALVGELGAGKTFFTKALGKALGIKETIKSPSFNLLKVYSLPPDRGGKGGLKSLIHVDCYRLNSADELIDIGLLDYFKQKDTLIIIEWADKVKKILPKETIWLKFEMGKNEERVVKIS